MSRFLEFVSTLNLIKVLMISYLCRGLYNKVLMSVPADTQYCLILVISRRFSYEEISVLDQETYHFLPR